MASRVKVLHSLWFTPVTRIFYLLRSFSYPASLCGLINYMLLQRLHEFSEGFLQLVCVGHVDDVCMCLLANADVNECEDESACLGGQCTNSIGSYICSCPSGMELVDGASCRGTHRL